MCFRMARAKDFFVVKPVSNAFALHPGRSRVSQHDVKYRCLLVLLALPLMVGCINNSKPTPPASRDTLKDSCGATPIYKGGVPDWIRQQFAPSVRTDAIIYVVASPSKAAGILFGYPLSAGHPTNPSNKILWLVDGPPTGPSLEIMGHIVDSSVAPVRQDVPFIASGQAPSIVDFPNPGCWHLELSWSGHTATVDIPYH